MKNDLERVMWKGGDDKEIDYQKSQLFLLSQFNVMTPIFHSQKKKS